MTLSEQIYWRKRHADIISNIVRAEDQNDPDKIKAALSARDKFNELVAGTDYAKLRVTGKMINEARQARRKSQRIQGSSKAFRQGNKAIRETFIPKEP